MNCKTLGDLGTIITGKTPPTKEASYWNGNIPFITPKDIQITKHVFSTERCISSEGLEKVRGAKLPAGAICVSCIGNIGYVGVTTETSVSNQQINSIVVNDDNDSEFVFYLLKNLWIYFKNYEGQSTTLSILNKTHFSEIEVNVPEKSVQKKIATILSCIDNKIELNQKINSNLERQAEAIFQSWFTDGKEINGCLADICQYSNEKVAVSLLDLDSYYSTENMLPGKAGATQAAKLPTITQTTKCNAGDVLVSNIRPYFKKIVYCYADCGCSTDVLCFTPKQGTLSAYLFFTLYADGFFDFMVAGSKGTKMPRGDKQQIMMYPVYAPSDEELTRFNSIAQPILKQIQLNREENKRLIALRDMLLPKLMTGEIIL